MMIYRVYIHQIYTYNCIAYICTRRDETHTRCSHVINGRQVHDDRWVRVSAGNERQWEYNLVSAAYSVWTASLGHTATSYRVKELNYDERRTGGLGGRLKCF